MTWEDTLEILPSTPEVPTANWFGLYPKSSRRNSPLYTNKSVEHPAKQAPKLTQAILMELVGQGLLHFGDLVADPFGGIGTTALEWCAMNPANRAVTCELERHYYAMAMECRTHASATLDGSGEPLENRWSILRGDSRYMDEYLAGDLHRVRELYRAEMEKEFGVTITAIKQPEDGYPTAVQIGLTSPPYGKGVIGKCDAKQADRLRALTEDPTSSLYGRDPEGAWFQAMIRGYDPSAGNIDLLASDGDLDAVAITSPPYGKVTGNEDRPSKHQPGYAERYSSLGIAQGDTKAYGDADGQIGAMKDPDADYPEAAITSPPYVGTEVRSPKGGVGDAYRRNGTPARGTFSDVDGSGKDLRFYGEADGQIGKMTDDLDTAVAVTSPPYSGNIKSDYTHEERDKKRLGEGFSGSGKGSFRGSQDYGRGDGQIGAMRDPDVDYPEVAVSSPPYEDSLGSADPDKKGGLFRDPKRRNDRSLTATYAPRAEAAVTSAPYEAQSGGHPMSPTGPLADPKLHARHAASKINKQTGYGENCKGQIGVMQKDTYATACRDVYRAMSRARIPIVVLVVKNPIKAQKLRRLDQLTINLMHDAGYELFFRARAFLYETVEQLKLRGQPYPEKLPEKSAAAFSGREDQYPVGSISVFHRIHLGRGLRAPAQHEDVLFFRIRSEI